MLPLYFSLLCLLLIPNMNIKFSFDTAWVAKVRHYFDTVITPKTVVAFAMFFSIITIIYCYNNDVIIAYGDAESHLNIAKRVITSLTPGFDQLGGIWLPLPHIMMVPFIWIDPLWRSGIAGSIVSGFAYVISCLFLYLTTYKLTKSKLSSFICFIIFALNPNILYLQTTAMTELVLIMFFILSTYWFINFLRNPDNIIALLATAFFGFCASLSRYDGWFLVLFQALAIILLYIFRKGKWKEMEGKLVLFCTLAFFGIALWMLWDFLILHDPFYFTNSQFSAKTQQQNWLSKGELPGYHNIIVSSAYYFVTSMANTGILIFLTALGGFFLYMRNHRTLKDYLMALVLLVPFIFNVTTLFLGQSVIFIPHLTPVTFEWKLFNVRYGVMMMPVVALFFAYLFYKLPTPGRLILVGIFFAQIALYLVGYSAVISYDDGIVGLSHAKRPDAERWLAKEYDGGLVLLDDYARTVSIIRSGLPMQNVIYVGNKPYWEESFYAPEKYAKWVVMQKDDAVWKGINNNTIIRGRLYKYFSKVYTSPETLIFKRNPAVK